MENRSKSTSEKWVKIECEGIHQDVYVVSELLQNGDGLRITMDNEIDKVEILFDGFPLLIREAQEEVRMRTWGEVQISTGNKRFFRNHFLYLVENSLLTDWVIAEGCGFYEKEKIKHFCIVTIEEIIDVVAGFDPIIRVSKLPGKP